VDLALRGDYKRRLSQIYTIIGTYKFMVEEDFPKAFKYLEDSFSISEELNDAFSLLFASFWLGSGLCLACKFEEALYKLQKAIDMNMAANNLWGTSIIKSIQSIFVYYFQGTANLAYQTSYDAIRIAEQSGDIGSKSWAYVSHGISCYGKGLLQEATENLLKGIALCERISLFHCNALAQNCLGEMFFENGEYQNSKSHFEKAMWLIKENRSSSGWMHVNKLALALAKIMIDEKDINVESLCAYVNENKIKSFEGLMRKYIGEILLNVDEQHTFDAEEWIKRAIDADKRNGMKLFLGRDYALYAKLFRRIGDASKAKENVNKAIEIFRECNADGWVKIASEGLGLVSYQIVPARTEDNHAN
jgi:tetratricopeptide (TPR) repeat protein